MNRHMGGVSWSIAGLAVLLLIASAAYAAESVKVTGEIIDTYCYAAMGAKGESHRNCGIGCATKGIPVGILQDGTGKVYVLLPEKDGGSLPKSVVDAMAHKVTITGKAYTVGGSQFLTVESLK